MERWQRGRQFVEVSTGVPMSYFVHFARSLGPLGVGATELHADSAVTDVVEIVHGLGANEVLVVEWAGPGVAFDLRFEAGDRPWTMLEFDPREEGSQRSAMVQVLARLAIALGRPVELCSESGDALETIRPDQVR